MPKKPPPDTLRIATYNIQKCVGMDLRRRPERTLQVLSGLGADVAVLQEADKRLPPRPAALPHFLVEETGWQAVDLGGAGSLGWHGNAVLFRDSVRLRAEGHIALPGLEPRGAVWALFETEAGLVRVIGAHLGLPGRARRGQMHALARAAEADNAAVVLAGDFNEWSRSPVLEHIAPALTFLPPKASFPALRPLGALDRIAHCRRLEAVAHGVHGARPAHIASDHLPVWADLRAV
ncbi:endonuclease/exonuclease/phosphatase family protein [Leisingera aquaemixtae]|uniref:Endonuclease/Exonuclease/phosphatase family protein n=1 Tax=Leisingera aquaemixtae TaxID=1396826 RepID=A0A0P1HF67_9RHOB|nr:endonuclease/exonuclease/phosphatase family protein [Leisingera aquaemixtae]CUI02120.1 Endonuclease/Exonuclease/phosphatase family protein [Leisingera aquaemixtae]